MCNSHKSEIIGKWKFTKTLINGKEDINHKNHNPIEIELLRNGEQLYFIGGKRFGIGKYKYKVVGDSLLWANEIHGVVQNTMWLKYSVDNDTLTMRKDSILYYLERSY